jgi:hypothetical protein
VQPDAENSIESRLSTFESKIDDMNKLFLINEASPEDKSPKQTKNKAPEPPPRLDYNQIVD